MNKPLLVISLFWIFLNCFGNAGVFRGYGQAPVLEKSSEVQMVEEEVIMIPRRGDYPMDLSCRNFDRMDFRCRFRLRNLSDREVELQVGFPLSTEAVFFHDPGEINQSEIISRFAFTAGTRETVYKVRFVPWDKERRFSNLFLWEMKFAPGEEIELLVNYTMEGYLGLGMTRRERDFSNLVNYQCEYLEFMSSGISQTQSYVTETGSSWAGEIEKARFRYYHRDFENYLARRGAWEETEAEREKHTSDTFTHVKNLRAFTISPTPFFIYGCNRRPSEHLELSCMCMPRKRKLYVCFPDYFASPMRRIMGYQHRKTAVAQSIHCLAEISVGRERRFASVLNAYHSK